MKILLAEDEAFYFEAMTKILAGKAEVLHGWKLAIVKDLFVKHQGELELVIMDGCLEGIKADTMPLIREMRSMGFTKPIIASSGHPGWSRQLVEAGASHAADKNEAASLALKLLARISKEANK